MATSRPFAYNTGASIPGTQQIGNLAVGTPSAGFESTGLKWWNGPDEDLGYVIAHQNPTGQPGADDTTANLGFFRTDGKIESNFIDLSEDIARLENDPQNFSSGGEAKTWLNDNGYWTSFFDGPVTSNLVLYYNPADLASYSGTGNTINDLSVSGLNGTMSNISFTSPYFTYNGSSSQIMRSDNAILEPGSGDWTMESWFRITANQSSVILGKFDNGGGSEDVSYSIRLNAGGNLFAQLGNGTPSGFINSTLYATSINTWYQVVYVWKNVASNSLETYINGVSIGSVSHSLASILNTSNNLYIGSYNGGEFSQWFNGRIGIVRLYNSALSATDVLQNFNANKSIYGL